MKLISHRGNLNGVNPILENEPTQIETCIKIGYGVEIDLRIKNGVPHLGHDYAQYPISKEWISSKKENLWIHVKEYDALTWLLNSVPDSTYFCHQSDEFTVVNNGYVWLHNLKNMTHEKCVIPLLGIEDIQKFDFSLNPQLGFVCTDFVLTLENLIKARRDK